MSDLARTHGRMSTDEDSSRVPVLSVLADFSFAYTGTSAASAAVTDASIKDVITEVIVRLSATTDCWVTFGASPVAVAGTGVYLAAGVVEYWRMNKGDAVAAIQESANGDLSVTLCA